MVSVLLFFHTFLHFFPYISESSHPYSYKRWFCWGWFSTCPCVCIPVWRRKCTHMCVGEQKETSSISPQLLSTLYFEPRCFFDLKPTVSATLNSAPGPNSRDEFARRPHQVHTTTFSFFKNRVLRINSAFQADTANTLSRYLPNWIFVFCFQSLAN